MKKIHSRGCTDVTRKRYYVSKDTYKLKDIILKLLDHKVHAQSVTVTPELHKGRVFFFGGGGGQRPWMCISRCQHMKN